jgi:hypothetical protein
VSRKYAGSWISYFFSCISSVPFNAVAALCPGTKELWQLDIAAEKRLMTLLLFFRGYQKVLHLQTREDT